MLAMIWSPRQILPKTGGSIFETLGWAGLLALMLLYNRLNEFQPFLYRGGIIVVALASALLVVGATATKRSSLTSQAAGSDTDSFSRLTAAPTIDLPRVTFIGDSIMPGVTPMIEDVFGEDIYIDAARKRKMEDVPALVKTLSREGHLSHVVVIHLGSNRPVEVPVFDNGMEALLDLGVERAIFINVHRPIGWEYYLNRNFMEGVARWQQAEMIDWDALAHSEQGWFIRDQTHLSYAGSEAYVNAIQEKLGTDP